MTLVDLVGCFLLLINQIFFNIFLKFQVQVLERMMGLKIKEIQTDQRGEFMNK